MGGPSGYRCDQCGAALQTLNDALNIRLEGSGDNTGAFPAVGSTGEFDAYTGSDGFGQGDNFGQQHHAGGFAAQDSFSPSAGGANYSGGGRDSTEPMGVEGLGSMPLGQSFAVRQDHSTIRLEGGAANYSGGGIDSTEPLGIESVSDSDLSGDDFDGFHNSGTEQQGGSARPVREPLGPTMPLMSAAAPSASANDSRPRFSARLTGQYGAIAQPPTPTAVAGPNGTDHYKAIQPPQGGHAS
ncbi:MAG: hypothetical protein AAFS10_27850, partial [Myxococcota bacterium]